MAYNLRSRLTPDQISSIRGRVLYRCAVCDAVEGLHWFAGTRRPVCSKPECTAEVTSDLFHKVIDTDHQYGR